MRPTLGCRPSGHGPEHGQVGERADGDAPGASCTPKVDDPRASRQPDRCLHAWGRPDVERDEAVDGERPGQVLVVGDAVGCEDEVAPPGTTRAPGGGAERRCPDAFHAAVPDPPDPLRDRGITGLSIAKTDRAAAAIRQFFAR